MLQQASRGILSRLSTGRLAATAVAASPCVVEQLHWRSAPFPLILNDQPRRWRHQQDPGNLRTRLIRAVTEPVVPHTPVCDTERRLRLAEERKRQLENSGYLRFLTAECRREIFDAAEGKLMLLLEMLPNRMLLSYGYRNSLHQVGFAMPRRYRYPIPVIQRAALGTKWQSLTDLLVPDGVFTAFAIGPAEPKACREALGIVDASPYLLLLGGVAEDRMLTAQQVRQFARLPELATARGQLIGALDIPAASLVGLLQQPASELISVLDARVAQLEQKATNSATSAASPTDTTATTTNSQ